MFWGESGNPYEVSHGAIQEEVLKHSKVEGVGFKARLAGSRLFLAGEERFLTFLKSFLLHAAQRKLRQVPACVGSWM